MGSSKKHKEKNKEKKRHRRGSRSRSREREGHRHGHKNKTSHREKKSIRDIPEDYADFVPQEKARIAEDCLSEPVIKEEPEFDEVEELLLGPSEKGASSISIESTNKLRAKLGLKPLQVSDEGIPGLGGDEDVGAGAEGEGTDERKEVFVKTENISEKKDAEKIRERLAVLKEKRQIQDKFRKTKSLGECESDDESASIWIHKSRKLQAEKEKAEKRAKLLEEMDEEFGIGDLVEKEFGGAKKGYTSKNLKGMTVGHSHDLIKEGQTVILTLKDKGVLEEDDDILENVNLIDEEKAAKNVQNKKKKPDYNPYEEPEYDEFGIVKKKQLLSKYDEEVNGAQKETFKLGSSGLVNREKELELIRMKLKQQQGVTLDSASLKLATDYYTEEELAQFKKPKKRKLKRIRKSTVLKAEDLLPLPGDMNRERSDFGTRMRHNAKSLKQDLDDEYLYGESNQITDAEQPDDSEMVGPEEDLTGITVYEEDAETDLYVALTKARKLKQKQSQSLGIEKLAGMVLRQTEEQMDDIHPEAGNKGAIILNSTAEFCRTLGEIPTYGMSGNRDEEAEELLDYEKELLEERQKQDLDPQNRGAWNEVDIDETPVEIKSRSSEPILEEEPDVSSGLAGALTLAVKKGYIEKEARKQTSAPQQSHLQAQTYTIEEKFYEDDKFGRRERYAGPVTDFREKDSYKPDIKLEYIDDSGRLLNHKEAFRYLSHKFHGKGPGKNKVDKRMKKLDQEGRLKQMSSTDTPLETLKLLQQKQKELQSPFIVLSGGSKAFTQNSIVKSK